MEPSDSRTKAMEIKGKVKNHIKEKVMIVDDQDRQIWEMMTNVPLVTKPVAIISAILNLILPGFGTVLAAC